MTEAEIRDAERWGYRSSLDVPLISHGEVIGFISLANFDRRAFARQEMVVGLAQVASQAISNAALFARARQTARETQLLNDIASRTAASLDLEEVVTAAVDELGQLMTFADHSVLLLEGHSIGTVISSRPRADALLNVRLDDFGADFVERLAADAVTVLRLPDDVPALAGSPAIEGLRSAIVVALPSDAGLLGVLNLSSADADAFADADRHLLERVGTQLSLAIKNAQLYEEIKRMHLGNLKALSSALNAKDYYTFGHAARVATYTVMLGRELGWPEDMLDLSRGGRLPPRHRQDQHLGPGAAQARPSEPAGVGADAGASGGQRRHHPPALPGGPGARRPLPPRALRRDRIPGRARR